jgi:hypothetical protein
MGKRSILAAVLAGVLAVVAACSSDPAPKIWRNGAGIPVDPVLGTTLPGSPPQF